MIKSKNSVVIPAGDGAKLFSSNNGDKNQAVHLVYGAGGSGKTAYAVLFAPDPVLVINYDGRADPVVKQAREAGRKIDLRQIDVPAKRRLTVDEVMAQSQQVMRSVEDVFFWGVEQNRKGNLRTILVDTATEHSQVQKLAFDGVVEQTKKGAFGKDKDFIYDQWWDLIREARKSSVNLVIAARESEIWVEDEKGRQKATGRYKFKCPGVINDAVDLSMHTRLKKGVAGRLKKEFELEVTKSGPNLAELGQIYTQKEWGDMGPFVWACLMQYEGSSPDDWS